MAKLKRQSFRVYGRPRGLTRRDLGRRQLEHFDKLVQLTDRNLNAAPSGDSS
jgi:hypothetical protein